VGIATTAATVVLGAGLTISGAVLDTKVEERAAGLARRGSPWACSGGAYKDECAELHSLATTRDVLGNVGLGSFILGGVIGGVTLASFLWSPKDERKRPQTRAHVRVMPTANPKQAGAMITGAW
jgi:hypothetical protein